MKYLLFYYLTLLFFNISNTSPTYRIGDVVNGGVVFWLENNFDSGQHGLVMAFSDAATGVEWGCLGSDLPSVPNVVYKGSDDPTPNGNGAYMGDGEGNTNNILSDCPNAQAALAARSLGSEWFLPSIGELKLIYSQMYYYKTKIEAVEGFSPFSNNYYWSSTEISANNAWFKNFANGAEYDINLSKGIEGSVRAVKRF